MAIGASLWGLFNNTGDEFGSGITKPGTIGGQYGYVNLRCIPGSEVFGKARATGLYVGDWQNVVLVNMIGKRFYDETGRQFTLGNYGSSIDPYVPDSYFRNGYESLEFKPNTFLDAALVGIGDGHNGGGPIWAISTPMLPTVRNGSEAAQCRLRRRFLLHRGHDRGPGCGRSR